MRTDRLVARGSGPPVVLVPGIQGRWEWMAPAVAALSAHHRVLTFSLNDASQDRFFDAWFQRIDEVLDHAAILRAPIVGVSFGGVIAACYAARRPGRVSRLVLVSSPGPTWRIDAQSEAHVRQPLLRLPLFAARAAQRLAPEAAAALPGWTGRSAFALRHALRTLSAPTNPVHMAAWVREWMQTDILADVNRVNTPTLVITGEPHLDRVVPVASSLEYVKLIAGARHRTIRDTGHMGLILKPAEFQHLVTEFVTEGE